MSAKEPAFPCGINQVYTDIEVGEPIHRGLTKREHAAIEMMKAIIANPNYEPPRRNIFRRMAIDAIGAADALLAQLAKEQT